MKKIFFLILTALLLLGACTKEEASATEPEPAPSITEPAPEPEQEPDEPPREPEAGPGPAPAPIPEPTPGPGPAPEPETDAGIAVHMDERSGRVERLVNYKITVPKLEGDGEGAAAINAYYEKVAANLYDLAQGEVYEGSEDRQTPLTLIGDSAVERNDGKVISIRRSVAVYDMRPETGELSTGVQYTQYAETFDVQTGGLLTPGDIFDADEGEYTERLTENVVRYIREHPDSGHGWAAGWETLAAERFDRDRFYLTEDAYVVWYGAGEVSSEEMEIPIPWRQLADILKIEV